MATVRNYYGDDIRRKNRSAIKGPTNGVVSVVVGCTLIITVLVAFSRSKMMPNSIMTNFSTTYDEFVVTMGRVNYSPVPYFNSNKPLLTTYKILEKYMAIIEPSANMELQFYDSALLDHSKYYYKICKSSDVAQESCQEGFKYKLEDGSYFSGTVNFSCDLYESFEIEVYQSNPLTEEITGKMSGKGLCLYVRREIRSLTTDDLDHFIDVSHVLSSTTDEEGQKLYGASFHTDSMLLRFHHFNAGQQDADHVHEGNGFLTQHLKFTNLFEASLQAVDSSVYLPYWDFTMDDAERHTVSNSYVIAEKLYGGMHAPKDIMKGFAYKDDPISAGIITNGRWAGLKAEMNNVYPDLKYGYGYMRAPWSMNPSPYISRFTSVFNQAIMLPSCDMHRTVLEKYDDMMDFFNAMAYEPHATIHTLAGGIYGCDLLLSMVEKGYLNDEAAAYSVCKGWTFNLKEWYRHNYILPRKNCVVNETNLESSVCGFDCVAENRDSLISFIFSSVSRYGDVTKAGAADAWLDFICDGGDGGRIFPGDHLESASPADPSFWVIHPTLERLLQFRLMSGGFKTSNWHVDPTKEYVCNKAKCYKASEGRSDYFEDCCYGHYEHDRLLDATTGLPGAYFGPTNAEVVAGTDPRSEAYSMSYVYDHFSWPHCTAADFDGLFTLLTKKAASSSSSSSTASSAAASASGQKSGTTASSATSSSSSSAKKAIS